VIALGAIVSMVTSPGDAVWSQIGAAAIMAPSAWIGGKLAAARPA
jgi:hypothetical protein